MASGFLGFDLPASVKLGGDDVHVWNAAVERSEEKIAVFFQLLSPDEQARALQFYFDKDRQSFVFGRGVLRIILCQYVSVQPDKIRFQYGAQGKPALAETDLQFNLSHSNERVVYAVTTGRRVGIDLEYVRPLDDYEQVAASVFSPPELALFHSLPAEHRLEAFYDYWTRKEAFIKAVGQGMSLPLDGFDVTPAPEQPVRMLGRDDLIQCWLAPFVPAVGYKAALAAEGPGWQFVSIP